MNLIIIHKNNPPPTSSCRKIGVGADTKSSSDNLLRFALANEPIAGVVLDGLSRGLRWGRNGKIVCAIPEEYISQRSEVRGQKSEVRGQKLDASAFA